MVRRWFLVVAFAACLPAAADDTYQLVLGSFANPDNAERWAQQLTRQLRFPIGVAPLPHGSALGYRVVTAPLQGDDLQQAIRAIRAHGLDFWRLATPPTLPDAVAGEAPDVPEDRAAARVTSRAAPASAERRSSRDAAQQNFDVDIGVQWRGFPDQGLDGQSRSDASISVQSRYYASWASGAWNAAITPFGRYDAQDDHRTHADLREFYISTVGDDWDLYVGSRQIFWGVTEFNHLVDIINQTDLVEDIDGEVKLGQPMLNLSLVRTWGIVDFFVMPYFRERTFPGEDGRLRHLVPVDDGDVLYDAGKKQQHVDLAVRWAHNLGPVEFGLYQFSGTSRAPQLFPVLRPNGQLVLRPYYDLIEQTGLDAQVIVGDWAFKLEALSRAGQGNRYAAATGGFERTLVGVLGGRSDLGLVLEYIWDQRDDEADSIYDHDIAIAGRWRLNDVADSQALLGLMWDVRTDEYIVNLEASRRLGDRWSLGVEGRLFGGTNAPPTSPPAAVLDALADQEHKLDQLARDDYIQLELTRYF